MPSAPISEVRTSVYVTYDSDSSATQFTSPALRRREWDRSTARLDAACDSRLWRLPVQTTYVTCLIGVPEGARCKIVPLDRIQTVEHDNLLSAQ